MDIKFKEIVVENEKPISGSENAEPFGGFGCGFACSNGVGCGAGCGHNVGTACGFGCAKG